MSKRQVVKRSTRLAGSLFESDDHYDLLLDGEPVGEVRKQPDGWTFVAADDWAAKGVYRLFGSRREAVEWGFAHHK